MSNNKLIYIREKERKQIEKILTDLNSHDLNISFSRLAVLSIIELFKIVSTHKLAKISETDHELIQNIRQFTKK